MIVVFFFFFLNLFSASRHAAKVVLVSKFNDVITTNKSGVFLKIAAHGLKLD